MNDLPKKKILVVDDEEYLVQLLKSRLMVNRFEVVTALSGREGLEKLRSEKPDLVVLDVLMPELNGVEFVQKVRRDPALRNVPVIVISAQPDTKSQFDLKEISAFVSKPFQPDEFIAQIKRALK